MSIIVENNLKLEIELLLQNAILHEILGIPIDYLTSLSLYLCYIVTFACRCRLSNSLSSLLTFLLCETNLDDSIDSANFSVRGYLPLIQKDSGTHMHGLAVYVKEGLPFARDLSLENSADSYLCF